MTADRSSSGRIFCQVGSQAHEAGLDIAVHVAVSWAPRLGSVQAADSCAFLCAAPSWQDYADWLPIGQPALDVCPADITLACARAVPRNRTLNPRWCPERQRAECVRNSRGARKPITRYVITFSICKTATIHTSVLHALLVEPVRERDPVTGGYGASCPALHRDCVPYPVV